MNPFGLILTLATCGLLLYLPRRWAPLPFLIGTIYLTIQQEMEIGPLHFPAFRLLILTGILRILMKKERIAGGGNVLDRMIIFWAIWMICSTVFHKSEVWVTRLGDTYNVLGSYFLFRIFIQELEDIRLVFKMLCLLLVPMAAVMIFEKLTGRNPLAGIGFGAADVAMTNGHNRAQGAFAHPILAGTVGGICLPMAIYLWRLDRKLALAGLGATLGIVYASGSSGPVMTTFSVLGAMMLWKTRTYMRTIRWLAVILIVALDLVMNDPVYFLMARIDITGGSTGYFRAQLIRSAIAHLDEWWLAGTDYTRHWMATGISENSNHTDMTNYFLQMGVWGGLLLMLLFMGVLCAAFVTISRAFRMNENAPVADQFLFWTLGAILFGHATTFFSISYFDQTVVFLYLLLASIGTLPSLRSVPATDENANWSSLNYEPDRCQSC